MIRHDRENNFNVFNVSLIEYEPLQVNWKQNQYRWSKLTLLSGVQTGRNAGRQFGSFNQMFKRIDMIFHLGNEVGLCI